MIRSILFLTIFNLLAGCETQGQHASYASVECGAGGASVAFALCKAQGHTDKNCMSQAAAIGSAGAAAVCGALPKFSKVSVLFATNRNREGSGQYGTQRGEVSFGSLEVSIPSTHRMGEIESPSIFKLEFQQDPNKHIVVVTSDRLSKERFLGSFASAPYSSGGDVLLFVHGYDTTFVQAALRTAQITYDLNFGGHSVFFSWPSSGDLSAYIRDESNIAWAERDMKNVLTDILQSAQGHVYILGHSMGTRGLTSAVVQVLAEKPELASRISELILAAPDIDLDIFRRDIAPHLATLRRPTTIYASSTDNALNASSAIHDYSRVGQIKGAAFVAVGFETIDASNIDTSFIGHSYYGGKKSAIGDIYYIIHGGKRAAERFDLEPVHAGASTYWRFKP